MQDDLGAVPDQALGHDGELDMRERFPGPYHWNETNLAAMIQPRISPALARFIEAQPFFFIATAKRDGHCDCSFRGREYSLAGRPLPALKVLDAQKLIFPDFSGNGLYNSLGNIRVNPHIGMLFMDFEHQRRARLNGIATIALLGRDGGKLESLADMAVIVPHDVTARIQEAHIFILHHWADVLERAVAQK